MSPEAWFLIVVIGLLVYYLFLYNNELRKRKRFETVVAMLRDRETLNEQQVELYMTAKKFDWLERPITN